MKTQGLNKMFKQRLKNYLEEGKESMTSLAERSGVHISVISLYVSDPDRDILYSNALSLEQCMRYKRYRIQAPTQQAGAVINNS